MTIPYFTTTYSVGRGLFTLGEPAEIKNTSPVSVFSVAKKYNLPEVYLIENSFLGFFKAYKVAEKHNIQFNFGYKLCVCEDENIKTEESYNTESNIIIWALNSQGYKDLSELVSYASTVGFYHIPRISWKSLKSKWTKNLALSIPFYSGFIAKNYLEGHSVVPDFPEEPLFHLENHSHPLDSLIESAVLNFCKTTGYKTQNLHKCSYFLKEDLEALMTYRISTSRSEYSKASINKPELTDFGLNTFSFEQYLLDNGQII